MKRLPFAALIFFLVMGAVFSEIKFSPDTVVSPSVEARLGYLFYSPENSSYFRTERIELDVKTKNGEFKVGGRHLYGNSDRSKVNGQLEYGSADFEFSQDSFVLRTGFSSFSFPDELKIFDEKPRFSIAEESGNALFFGGDLNFLLFDEDWKLSSDWLFGNANAQSGDLYYFYGKPDNFFLFGNKTRIQMPLDFELFLLGGAIDFDIDTNEQIKVGDANLRLISAFVAKKFFLPFGDDFTFKPFLGYAWLSVSSGAFLTSATQQYMLFPYKAAGGNIDERFYFISLGNSLEFQKAGFIFSLDFIYLFCMKNSASGNFAYKYKKTAFFDGSSDSGDLDLPDAAGMHVFAGIMEASYKFVGHKNFSPKLCLTKMIAAAILNASTKDFLNTSFSSYSTISPPSESVGVNAENNDGETLKKALLSGTSISLRIDF